MGQELGSCPTRSVYLARQAPSPTFQVGPPQRARPMEDADEDIAERSKRKRYRKGCRLRTLNIFEFNWSIK